MIFGNAKKKIFFLQMLFRENFYKLVKTFSMFSTVQEQNNNNNSQLFSMSIYSWKN